MTDTALTKLMDELVEYILCVVRQLSHQRYPCLDLATWVFQLRVLLQRGMHADELGFEGADLAADPFEAAILTGEKAPKLHQQGTQGAIDAL